MSFMNLNGGTGNSTTFWNFANKENEGYSTTLVGYVVEIDLVCKTKFGTNIIERFDDGNPKRNVRIIVQTDDGQDVAWEFSPGGRDKSAQGGEDKRSAAMKALANAITASIPKATDVEDCLGCRIKISTGEPPEGFSYSRQTPRPWDVQIDASRRIESRGCFVKPDWEREGGEVDARPIEPPQVGSDPNNQPSAEFLAAQKRAADAVAKMNAGIDVPQQPITMNAQAEIPPASVYDDDIPF